MQTRFLHGLKDMEKIVLQQLEFCVFHAWAFACAFFVWKDMIKHEKVDFYTFDCVYDRIGLHRCPSCRGAGIG